MTRPLAMIRSLLSALLLVACLPDAPRKPIDVSQATTPEKLLALYAKVGAHSYEGRKVRVVGTVKDREIGHQGVSDVYNLLAGRRTLRAVCPEGSSEYVLGKSIILDCTTFYDAEPYLQQCKQVFK